MYSAPTIAVEILSNGNVVPYENKSCYPFSIDRFDSLLERLKRKAWPKGRRPKSMDIVYFFSSFPSSSS